MTVYCLLKERESFSFFKINVDGQGGHLQHAISLSTQTNSMSMSSVQKGEMLCIFHAFFRHPEQTLGVYLAFCGPPGLNVGTGFGLRMVMVRAILM